jgi:hypothetical protein
VAGAKGNETAILKRYRREFERDKKKWQKTERQAKAKREAEAAETMKNYQTAKPKPKSFGAIVGKPAPAAPSAAKKAEKAARCAALASAGTRKAENEAFMADCPGAHYHLLLE